MEQLSGFWNEGFRPRPVPAPADSRLGCGKLAQSQAGSTCDPMGGLFPIQLPGPEQLSGLAEEVRHLNFMRDAERSDFLRARDRSV